MIVKTKPSKEIYDFLNRVPIVNENIMGVMENEAQAEIYVDNLDNPRGVLVRYEYFNYIYTEDDNFLNEALEAHFKEGFYGFSGVYRPLAEKIRQRFIVNWESRCALYYLPKNKLDLSLISNPVQSIDIKDAETINEFYAFRNPGSLEKIQKDIKYRPSSAIYVDGQLACWVLVHNDNSMGIMYTLEAHRKKGYAVDVTLDLADKILKSGRTPFLQIREDNSMSPGLAAKCGFEKNGYADWFGIIVGAPQEIIDCNNQGRNEMFKTLGKSRELGDVKLLHTGVKGYNLVYDIRLDEEGLEKRVDELLEECKKLKEDFIWSMDSRNENEALARILEARGFKHLELMDCMYLPINLLNREHDLIEGFFLKEIEDQEGMEVWCDTLAKGLEFQGEDGCTFREMMYEAVSDKEDKFELYLGMIKGVPVSTAAMKRIDYDTWGAYFISVVPDMRDTGIMRAAVVESIQKAQRWDLECVMLQSHEEFVEMLRDIGFVHSHYIRNYGK